jgi:hypothetical protein
MSDWEDRESESEADSADGSEREGCDGDGYAIEATFVSVHSSGEGSEGQAVEVDDLEGVMVEVPLSSPAPCNAEIIYGDKQAGYHLEGTPDVNPWGDDTDSDKADKKE